MIPGSVKWMLGKMLDDPAVVRVPPPNTDGPTLSTSIWRLTMCVPPKLTPGNKIPEDLVPEVRAYKPEIVERVRQRNMTLRYRRAFPDDDLGDGELAEMVRRVEVAGVCLVKAEAVDDFVPYSEAELFKLFAPGQEDISLSTLQLIHAAKKTGARITGVEHDPVPGA